MVSVAYWAGVHPSLTSQGLLTSWTSLLLVALPGHTLNLLACLVDSLVSARPTSLAHWWPPALFGLSYLITR